MHITCYRTQIAISFGISGLDADVGRGGGLNGESGPELDGSGINVWISMRSSNFNRNHDGHDRSGRIFGAARGFLQRTGTGINISNLDGISDSFQHFLVINLN